MNVNFKMTMQHPASLVLVTLLACLSQLPTTYAATSYSYDSAGRLVAVTYEDDSSDNYNFDTNGNLLALTSAPNVIPNVAIVGGNRSISDTDGVAAELVNLSATATDSDGTVATTEWLVSDDVVATGLTLNIALPDGATEVTFRATDNYGGTSSTTATITVNAPPLQEGWPVPYSGITPDDSLGLEFNNISALNPQDGLIYSCIRILSNGVQSTVDGIDRYDIAFQIVSLAEATIGVVRAKPFNGTGALNENGELPDCSGAIEMTTSIYSDIIQGGSEVYSVKFELFDGVNLLMRAIELELIGTVP